MVPSKHVPVESAPISSRVLYFSSRRAVAEGPHARARSRQAGRQTDRQTDRETDRQADRQTGIQAGRQAGKQAGRQADIQTAQIEQISQKNSERISFEQESFSQVSMMVLLRIQPR